MKSLTIYDEKLKSLQKQRDKLSKQLDSINKKIGELTKDRYTCKKCNSVFTKKELGYRKYIHRYLKQDCQPMGDYDQTQIDEFQLIFCCPKCGKSFNEVMHKEILWCSSTYGRWDDRPRDYRQPLTCKKLLDKTIYKQ